MSTIDKPKRYLVEVVETLARQIVVEAEDADDAYMKTKEAYTSGQIILDSEDFMDYEIFTIHNVSPEILDQERMLIKEDGTIVMN